jgi:3-oxoacid CoA-transferase
MSVSSLQTYSCDLYGLEPLLLNGQVQRATASFVANSAAEKLYHAGLLELDAVPMGTLVEKLRAGGAGIPAFYTSTGLNSLVEHGGFPIKYAKDGVVSQPKETGEFDGRRYLLERSVTTDFGLVKAWKADKLGNLVYRYAAQNYNSAVATASKCTIAEVDELVDELPPSEIHTPAVYVQRLVKAPGKVRFEKLMRSGGRVPDDKLKIIKRAVKEVKSGMTINLGIGTPTLLPEYLDCSDVQIQAENGILGVGPYPGEGEEHHELVNPGRENVTLTKGASLFSSLAAFNMIKGGCIDVSFIGALEVSRLCDVANWYIPGKVLRGMGGAMDLLASPSRIVVLMPHVSKGSFKLVENCSLPLTGKGVADLVITDLGVFAKQEGRLVLIEIAAGVSLDQLQALTGFQLEVSSNLRQIGE